jgi:methionyl-tRNA formyltransferase
MRTIFLSGGQRELALKYILNKGIEVVAIITPILNENNNRFQEVINVGAEYGVPIFPTKKTDLGKVIKGLSYDVLISCGYPYIIGSEILLNGKIAINVHPTLLPKYRGFRSGPYIIINNEDKSGVTVHFLTEEMDKGDIIEQEEFVLTPFDTTKSCFRKARELEGSVLYRALLSLQENKIRPLKQNEEESSVFNYIRTPNDSEIDPKRSLLDLYNEIRACDPDDYPAFFYIEGQKVCISYGGQTRIYPKKI